MDIPKYKVITQYSVYNKPDFETLCEEQEKKLRELGIDNHTDYLIRFFDSPMFSWEASPYIESIHDALSELFIKDGADLVQYENGNYGFVAYYNDCKSGFEIIKDN